MRGLVFLSDWCLARVTVRELRASRVARTCTIPLQYG
jgi:hypothetical protein